MHVKNKIILIVFTLLSSISITFGAVGDDLRAVFAKAAAGEPICSVAIGGSITQGGQGWVDPWLRRVFPQSSVNIVNAGLSGTGSELGIFRLERDVISLQPDLVLIEFAVNDGGLSDEEAIRYNESIVVRLKQLPHPPAIVFVETAARHGSNRMRHEKVAAHYELVNIDLQLKLDEYIKKNGVSWDELMSDDVHPRKAGYELYWRWIGEALAPYLPRKGEKISTQITGKLPKPLSSRSLILDGKLLPLSGMNTPGWREESTLSNWWDRFCTGALASTSEQAPLSLHARGTHLGLFYLEDPAFGKFRVSVDGRSLTDIDSATRKWYAYRLLGKDLIPQRHSLLVQPLNDKTIKLVFLMVAGEQSASNELTPMGPATATVLKNFAWKSLSADMWQWTGPYGGETAEWPSADLQTEFPPEADAESIRWQSPANTGGSWIDFKKMTGLADRGVCYARTRLHGKGGKALFALTVDYYAKIWINGQLIKVVAGSHGISNVPVYFLAELKPGENEIFIKVHSGSLGFGVGLAYEEEFAPNLPPDVFI